MAADAPPPEQKPVAETAPDSAAPEGATRYFILPRDEVFARLKDGWLSQVWQPNSGQWADYPDLDIAGEANELTEEEARQGVGEMYGEFGPDPFAEDAPENQQGGSEGDQAAGEEATA